MPQEIKLTDSYGTDFTLHVMGDRLIITVQGAEDPREPTQLWIDRDQALDLVSILEQFHETGELPEGI